MTPINLHATAVVLGRHGVLIAGASGAGKSALALHLIERCRAAGVFATLVADDQVWVAALGGRLVAEAPAPIAGLVEVRGFGPAATDHEKRAPIDLVVRLVPTNAAPRHSEDMTEAVEGIAIPRLDLSAGDALTAANAIAAYFGLRF
jgi:serine kinase of HPr protein (carbohydrate metabolism regulator)